MKQENDELLHLPSMQCFGCPGVIRVKKDYKEVNAKGIFNR